VRGIVNNTMSPLGSLADIKGDLSGSTNRPY
jgi:hypothetical protein